MFTGQWNILSKALCAGSPSESIREDLSQPCRWADKGRWAFLGCDVGSTTQSTSFVHKCAHTNVCRPLWDGWGRKKRLLSCTCPGGLTRGQWQTRADQVHMVPLCPLQEADSRNGLISLGEAEGGQSFAEPCGLDTVNLSPRLTFPSRDSVESLSFCKQVADTQAGGGSFC